MGSEIPPQDLIDQIISISKKIKDETILLLGDEKHFFESKKIQYIITKDNITLDDPPLLSIRRKKQSSICQGIRLIKEKKAFAFISAGNTGAIVAYAKHSLSLTKNIKRPALLTFMPTQKKPMAILDVGANVICTEENYIQFAIMATLFIQKYQNKKKPRLGLLNIGSESTKGSSLLKNVYKRLNDLEKSKNNFKFLGNIEGKDAFNGDIDILLTDGFTGNVFLKTAEGFAGFILDKTKKNTSKTISPLQNYLQFSQYRGAILCGVKGLIIKCHSYSSPKAITNAIFEAIDLFKKKL
jgi:phosphate acyltransferase